MRIISVDVRGVGGLADGLVELPPGPIVALAGANGTGKSKLLACLLVPWTGQVPEPREGATAEVVVKLQLTESEAAAIREFSLRIGWGDAVIPEIVEIGARRDPIAGQPRTQTPDATVLRELWNHQAFLSATPSLNVVFLPAERRLLEPRQQGIDLNQLSEEIAFQSGAESRAAVNNYGRLDDREFEDFAKALCVAANLPPDPHAPAEAEENAHDRIDWTGFKQTVDSLLAPKELLGLTRQTPDKLRIQTPLGDVHQVRDLSSGERQALIIISRVLRAGTSIPLVMIDEPDAYLHPHLSKRLILALEDGVGSDGQLIVATHSPAILDGVPPAAILRLQHSGPPRAVADEAERLELYRSAGFRSSALTQSDLLLITEGTTDASLLSFAVPELSSASIRSAGGKAQVLREVEQLKPYDLPILGVVDLDLNLTEIPAHIEADIFVWPAADVEGVYLSSDEALQMMIDLGYMKDGFSNVEQLRELLNELCLSQHENVVAEIARQQAVRMSGYEWPSPKGENALARLRAAVAEARPISVDALDAEIERAEALWVAASSDLLRIVRGKYVLSTFAVRASEMKSGRALLEGVARQRPVVAAIEEFTAKVKSRAAGAA